MTTLLIAIAIVETAILAATVWTTRRAFDRRRYVKDFPHAL